ncbi:unnamed protein product [Pseudo-nitzschia multistriata]|uniref:Uncharacterized protein n=1 Tax=Pseudo-nitzschia multistriata TaxID=183589 RepID=A0A448ZMU7_9STRA|nr:unnamed protein product [Pseudo-nitzschia multistriata]
MPSSMPSNTPSLMPSSEPSENPSLKPSYGPSENPSGIPSEIPSIEPSSVPSGSPTGVPSGVASEVPSVGPSSVPSVVPSFEPSSLPSSMPSIKIDFAASSLLPSDVASVSLVPSFFPSLPPSFSYEPSVSLILSKGKSGSKSKSSSKGNSSGKGKSLSKGKDSSKGKDKSKGKSKSEGKSSSKGKSGFESKSSSKGKSASKGKGETKGHSTSDGKSKSDAKSASNGKSGSKGKSPSKGKSTSDGKGKSGTKSDSKGESLSEGKSASKGKSAGKGKRKSKSQGKSVSKGKSKSQGKSKSLKDSSTSPSYIPSSFPSSFPSGNPSRPPTPCDVLETNIDIFHADVVQSNLEQERGELRFGNVGIVRGEAVDFLITSDDYTNSNPNGFNNGKNKNGFGQFGSINLFTIHGDSSAGRAHFKACFVQPGTTIEVIVDSFQWTVFDIDRRNSQTTGYNLWERLEIDATQATGYTLYPNPADSEVRQFCKNSLGVPPCAENEMTVFEALEDGTGADNPGTPDVLTELQKKRSVSFTFTDRSCFSFSYDAYCPFEPDNDCAWYGGNNFLFAGYARELMYDGECVVQPAPAPTPAPVPAPPAAPAFVCSSALTAPNCPSWQPQCAIVGGCPAGMPTGYYPDLSVKNAYCWCTGTVATSSYQRCNTGTVFNSFPGNHGTYLRGKDANGIPFGRGGYFGVNQGVCDWPSGITARTRKRPPYSILV